MTMGIGALAAGAGAGHFSQDLNIFAVWIDTVPAWVSKA